MTDTVHALSSGRPPAAIAIVRISGPAALTVAGALAGALPPPRQARVRALRSADGDLLDRALVIVFPGPASATGEDLIELHCHGGRAVVAAVEGALVVAGSRAAAAGEFTRRALTNGRIDLAQAEGLADLLEAETETQRVAALDGVEGRVGTMVRGWMARVASLSARVEAMLDFADEGDVEDDAALAPVTATIAQLAAEVAGVLAQPSVERLRDGVRVVIAGPPNAGKSTLLNLLAARQAAIVSPIAGTTRDRIEAPVSRGGEAYLLVDTAGLTDTADPVEAIGVERANTAIDTADLLLWLGDEPPPTTAVWVQARADLPGRERLLAGRSVLVSQDDVGSVDRLWEAIAGRTRAAPTRRDLPALRQHQIDRCSDVLEDLRCGTGSDPIIVAEQLRRAHRSLASLVGIDATEAMLDTLFARFCIGK